MNPDELVWVLRTVSANKVLKDPQVRSYKLPSEALEYITQSLRVNHEWFPSGGDDERRVFDRAVVGVTSGLRSDLTDEQVGEVVMAVCELTLARWQETEGLRSDETAGETEREITSQGKDLGEYLGIVFGIIVVNRLFS